MSYGILRKWRHVCRWATKVYCRCLLMEYLSYLSTFLTVECRRWVFSQLNRKSRSVKCNHFASYNGNEWCNQTNKVFLLTMWSSGVILIELLWLNTLPRFSLGFLDINECAPDALSVNHTHYANDCHDDSNCTNTKGSFYCTCLNGYSGNGVSCVGKQLRTSLFEGEY